MIKQYSKLFYTMALYSIAVMFFHIIYQGSQNTYPPVNEEDFSIIQADSDTNRTVSLNQSSFIAKFNKDNPGESTFKSHLPADSSFFFKFTFTDNESVECENDSIQNQPFLFNIKINGISHAHQSDSARVVSEEHKISPSDDVTFYIDELTNSCGAAIIRLVKKGVISKGYYALVLAIWLIFFCACYFNGKRLLPIVTVISLIVLTTAEQRSTQFFSQSAFLGVGLAPIFLAVFLLLASSIRAQSGRWVRWLVIVISSIVILSTFLFALISIGFDKIFDQQMHSQDWFAILQTDPNETADFISTFAKGKIAIGFYFTLSLLLVLGLLRHIKLPRVPRVSNIILAVLALSGIAWALVQTQPITLALESFDEFQNDNRILQQAIQERLQSNNHDIDAVKNEQGEIYLVVLGESANKFHFSLYNYPRTTNPLLEKRKENGSLIVNNNAYAAGISTLGTLRYVLTSAEIKGEIQPSESPSIIEVLNKASIDTYWIHNGSTAIRKDSISIISEQSKHVNRLSSAFGIEDGKLIKEVAKVLERNTPVTKVIFLKTQGNHIGYCARIKHDANQWNFVNKEYDNWLIPKIYPLTGISNHTDCYDGAVKYTDYILDELIKLLEKQSEPSALLYFSDHGEDVIRGTGHMSKQTFDVFSIPMMSYFSPTYRSKYPTKFSRFKKNSDTVIVNDQLFDTLLGVIGVKSNVRSEKNNLTSTQFKSNHLINRGRNSVHDAENMDFRTRNKIATVKEKTSNKNLILSMGRIAHPFHLSYVNGPQGYDSVAFQLYYEENELWMESLSEGKVKWRNVVPFLDLSEKQEIFIQVFQQSMDIDNSLLAARLTTELSKIQCNAPCNLTIATDDRKLADAMTDQGLRVALEISGNTPKSDLINLTNIYTRESSLPEIPDGYVLKEVTLVKTNCDFISCDPEQIQSELEALVGPIGLLRIVAAVHDL